jgi:Fe-S cluster assembly ATP-binding protein
VLKINDLYTKGKQDQNLILKGINLNLQEGELCVLMGPNGSGKSTLAQAIEGNPKVQTQKGQITFKETSLKDLTATERSLKGIFVAKQNPPQIEGLNIFSFLRLVHQKHTKQKISLVEFSSLLENKMNQLNLPAEFKQRSFNEGFSGGEKKKMEILQMLLIQPELAVLDEVDSGVDVDSLNTITSAIRKAVENTGMTALCITHNADFATKLQPKKVFVIKQGKIVKHGGPSLIDQVKEKGYEQI